LIGAIDCTERPNGIAEGAREPRTLGTLAPIGATVGGVVIIKMAGLRSDVGHLLSTFVANDYYGRNTSFS
jgi:hypothetical protein